jgi:hypothetical protein
LRKTLALRRKHESDPEDVAKMKAKIEEAESRLRQPSPEARSSSSHISTGDIVDAAEAAVSAYAATAAAAGVGASSMSYEFEEREDAPNSEEPEGNSNLSLARVISNDGPTEEDIGRLADAVAWLREEEHHECSETEFEDEPFDDPVQADSQSSSACVVPAFAINSALVPVIVATACNSAVVPPSQQAVSSHGRQDERQLIPLIRAPPQCSSWYAAHERVRSSLPQVALAGFACQSTAPTGTASPRYLSPGMAPASLGAGPPPLFANVHGSAQRTGSFSASQTGHGSFSPARTGLGDLVATAAARGAAAHMTTPLVSRHAPARIRQEEVSPRGGFPPTQKVDIGCFSPLVPGKASGLASPRNTVRVVPPTSTTRQEDIPMLGGSMLRQRRETSPPRSVWAEAAETFDNRMSPGAPPVEVSTARRESPFLVGLKMPQQTSAWQRDVSPGPCAPVVSCLGGSARSSDMSPILAFRATAQPAMSSATVPAHQCSARAAQQPGWRSPTPSAEGWMSPRATVLPRKAAAQGYLSPGVPGGSTSPPPSILVPPATPAQRAPNSVLTAAATARSSQTQVSAACRSPPQLGARNSPASSIAAPPATPRATVNSYAAPPATPRAIQSQVAAVFGARNSTPSSIAAPPATPRALNSVAVVAASRAPTSTGCGSIAPEPYSRLRRH